MGEFRMPALGADMTEGTLTEWLVHPGDRVDKGDIVAVIDTAKAAVEVECFESGTVTALLVEPGTTVAVGGPLAVIDAEGTVSTRATEPSAAGARATPLVRHLAEEAGLDLATVHGTGPGGRIMRADVATGSRSHADSVPAPPPHPAPGPRATAQARRLAAEAGIDLTTVQGTGADGRVGARDVRALLAADRQRTPGAVPPESPVRRPRVTPYARRLAAEAGIDPGTLPGSGPDGAVRAGDVRALTSPGNGPARVAAPTPTTAQPPVADRALAMRQAVGGLMARSKREIPHYYLATTVDLARAIDWMHARNLQLPVADRLVPAALLLRAAARAAVEVPELNGHWTDGRFHPADHVHLGVAVSVRGGGLVAPAIPDAAELSVEELMHALRDLVRRARAGRLRGTETGDPTITVTSLGDLGVEAVYGVIYPPQVALLGLGRVVQRPVAVEGLVGVHATVTATLSADHRASDGATGGRLLTAFDRLLQTPEEL